MFGVRRDTAYVLRYLDLWERSAATNAAQMKVLIVVFPDFLNTLGVQASKRHCKHKAYYTVYICWFYRKFHNE